MEEYLAIKPEGMKLPEIIPPGKTRITIRVDKDVIEWFRQQVELRGGGIPIVLMTNLDDEALALQAIRNGAQEYLLKTELSGERRAIQ